MSQKIKKIVVLSFVLIISSVFTRCQKEDDVSSPQSSQLSLARNWFKEYESSGENYALFQNLAYDWNEASITKSEDGTATIIVPVIELKKDQKEIWEQKLYLYKSGTDSYKAVLFEIYSNKNIEVSSQTIEGGDFSGYMTAWDLKTGFVRAAKFVNNQVVEIGDAEFSNDISLTSRAPIEAPCVYSGGDGGCDKGGGKAIELREVVVTGPSTGSPVVYIPRDAVTGGISTGGFTSPGAGGASSGGTDYNSSINKIVVVGPSKVITNIKDYLKCFDLSKNAELIIYVDQPTPNSADAYTLAGDVGHTFIAIQQGAIRRVLGYWPSTSINPVTAPTDKKAFGNDENHFFDVSISTIISSGQLGNIIDYCNNKTPDTYNLNTYNCTNFAIAVGKLGGLNFANSSGTWPGGGGNNPGQLGQNIRNMAVPANGNKQTAGANAASNKGICN